MTDTEIVDWIQRHVTKIHEDIDERMTVVWLGNRGRFCTTEGENLRDCIRKAALENSDSEKARRKPRTLSDVLNDCFWRGLTEEAVNSEE
jgi:hypothetical protein